LPRILKKLYYILLVIGLGLQPIYSQIEDQTLVLSTSFNPEKHSEIYQLKTDTYQIIELIKGKGGDYKGSLINVVWETNRKGILKNSISQKIKIPEKDVEILMKNLKDNGFEKLIDCSKIKNCISGLDGTTISFSMLSSDKKNNASYWELNSSYYYEQNNIKIPEEVINARRIYDILNSKYDLSEQFSNFINRLPKGSYFYGMQQMIKM